MTTMRGRIDRVHGPVGHRSFTLTELLAVIAIIVVIASVTVLSVRGVAREARLSSAVNTVTSALDHGRAMAIRDETLVAVVFRIRFAGTNKQQVEIVTARWTGETPLAQVMTQSGLRQRPIDRFVPVPGVASRRLPPGIALAAPMYHSGTHSDDLGQYWDEIWGYGSHLPTVVEPGQTAGDPPGRVFGVIFGQDGRVVMRNAASNAWRMYVDFNNDGAQQISGCTVCPNGEIDYATFSGPIPNTDSPPMFNVAMMMQHREGDEPYITAAPFLALYDEDLFRDEYDTQAWNNDNWQQKHLDLTEFVTENAERIHFNRYTGVVLR